MPIIKIFLLLFVEQSQLLLLVENSAESDIKLPNKNNSFSIHQIKNDKNKNIRIAF